ncbi:GNAT family N-acetyltransferase [Massilia sp. TWR1-2-2]|uniref:GNAT family N-acetyltransferase n=1 Tax=Massilia sp. TWR1-2-2 TaxID=2804584 RepID=UPI003CF445D0
MQLAAEYPWSPRAAPAPAPVQPKPGSWRFEASWASSPAEVREAQQLRYAVFVAEMGARLSTPAGTAAGLDVDDFDRHCEHLLVRARELGSDAPGQLVGTYRVLGPEGARRAGGCYTESEFDLAPLAPLRAGAVELGRACVHAGWRSGGVILALWSALGQHMLERGLDTMFGCASIGMADGGQLARRVWRQLRDSSYMVPPEWRIVPWTPLPMGDADRIATPASDAVLRELPALIKGYLRCGARVAGPPSFDRSFNTADLPIMMRLADLPARYSKQFLAPR